MYTGIVQAICPIVELIRKDGMVTLSAKLPLDLMTKLKVGASVGLDGVCLTVTSFDDKAVRFDVIQETLTKTTLGSLDVGSSVNVERSAKQSDEIGGHLLSGHVEGKAVIKQLTKTENNHIIEFSCPAHWMECILPKGYVAIDGASLTIVDTFPDGRFTVHLIPETLRATVLGKKVAGDEVNIELDTQTKTIVNTVKQYLQSQAQMQR